MLTHITRLLNFLKGLSLDVFWSELHGGVKVQKYGYLLPLGNEIPILLNFTRK